MFKLPRESFLLNSAFALLNFHPLGTEVNTPFPKYGGVSHWLVDEFLAKSPPDQERGVIHLQLFYKDNT
jgi:hypothetical protein